MSEPSGTQVPSSKGIPPGGREAYSFPLGTLGNLFVALHERGLKVSKGNFALQGGGHKEEGIDRRGLWRNRGHENRARTICTWRLNRHLTLLPAFPGRHAETALFDRASREEWWQLLLA